MTNKGPIKFKLKHLPQHTLDTHTKHQQQQLSNYEVFQSIILIYSMMESWTTTNKGTLQNSN